MYSPSKYIPRIKKCEKDQRDAEIYADFLEAKHVYPFWKWKSLIEMLAVKFNVSQSTVYRSISSFVKLQKKPLA